MSKTVDINELVKRLRELGATNSADTILTLTARAEAAEAERDRLKAALVRLASCEAFSFSQVIDSPELKTRIEFARKALGGDAS